jgi:hypothetical protein
MSSKPNFERIVLVGLVGIVAFLLGRTNLLGEPRPLLADTSADGDRQLVAVAAPYQLGVSLLYVIDTKTKNLAVYEARGGSRSQSRLSFVAARRIDLDLRLEGYHDDSEYAFSDLAAQFRQNGWTDVKSGSGDSAPAGNAEKGGEKANEKGVPEKPAGAEKPGPKAPGAASKKEGG